MATKKFTKSVKLTHTDTKGSAKMVDVSDKPPTTRTAIATGSIFMLDSTLQKIVENQIKKGDVLSAARLAGIMAAKKTDELIPLCHRLLLTSIEINFEICKKNNPHIFASAKVAAVGKTGVEMEALTAVSTSLLTIYDMAKAIDRFMTISEIKVIEKKGGKSGNWVNPNC